MSFLNSIFNQTEVQCPRCLGKGHVDQDDIKRLKRELHWLPAECAYCNGSGKVKKKIADQIPPDLIHLSTDRNPTERKRILENRQEALETALYEEEIRNLFIKQVIFLSEKAKLSADLIVEFFLETHFYSQLNEEQIQLLKIDIDNILKFNKNKNPN